MKDLGLGFLAKACSSSPAETQIRARRGGGRSGPGPSADFSRELGLGRWLLRTPFRTLGPPVTQRTQSSRKMVTGIKTHLTTSSNLESIGFIQERERR